MALNEKRMVFLERKPPPKPALHAVLLTNARGSFPVPSWCAHCPEVLHQSTLTRLPSPTGSAKSFARFFGTRKPARRRRRSGAVPTAGCKETTLLLTPPLLRVAFRVPRLLFLCRLSVLRSAQTGTTTA